MIVTYDVRWMMYDYDVCGLCMMVMYYGDV